MEITQLILVAGAISWITTALVSKVGPFQVIKKFREWTIKVLKENSPLRCYHCTSFWVGLVIISFYVSGDTLSRALIEFFGIIGIAQAIRGASGEWS